MPNEPGSFNPVTGNPIPEQLLSPVAELSVHHQFAHARDNLYGVNPAVLPSSANNFTGGVLPNEPRSFNLVMGNHIPDQGGSPATTVSSYAKGTSSVNSGIRRNVPQQGGPSVPWSKTYPAWSKFGDPSRVRDGTHAGSGNSLNGAQTPRPPSYGSPFKSTPIDMEYRRLPCSTPYVMDDVPAKLSELQGEKRLVEASIFSPPHEKTACMDNVLAKHSGLPMHPVQVMPYKDQQYSQGGTPISASTACSFRSVYSSITALTSPTSMDYVASPDSDMKAASTSLPLDFSRPSPVPFSHPPPGTGAETLRCQICNAPSSEKSNLIRHMRTVHDPCTKNSCPEPDCDRKFTRSDNLRKHRWVIHRSQEHAPRKKEKRNKFARS